MEVSTDGGRSFTAAQLGEDLAASRSGPSASRHALGQGQAHGDARAINKVGQTQTAELIQNPAGYHHNVMHTVTLNVA